MARILLVDDDNDFREMLRDALTVSQHEVIQATNGQEALDLFHENVVDLIITDIVMPQRGGIETIIDLKKQNPELKVIAISGVGQGGNSRMLDWAKRVGASKTFVKPFELKDLMLAIKVLLAKPTDVSVSPPE